MKTTTTPCAALLFSLLLFGLICVTNAEDSAKEGDENNHRHDHDQSEDHHDEVATLVIICVIAAIALIVFIPLGLLLIFCCCVGLACQQFHRPRAVVIQVPRHSSPLRRGNHYSTEVSPLVTFHTVTGAFQQQHNMNFTPSSSLSHLPPQNYAYNPQAQPHKAASLNSKWNAL
ncbi:hypothetical protein QOT17_007807 [Balamuthia mandrillaris]